MIIDGMHEATAAQEAGEDVTKKAFTTTDVIVLVAFGTMTSLCLWMLLRCCLGCCCTPAVKSSQQSASIPLVSQNPELQAPAQERHPLMSYDPERCDWQTETQELGLATGVVSSPPSKVPVDSAAPYYHAFMPLPEGLAGISANEAYHGQARAKLLASAPRPAISQASREALDRRVSPRTEGKNVDGTHLGQSPSAVPASSQAAREDITTPEGRDIHGTRHGLTPATSAVPASSQAAQEDITAPEGRDIHGARHATTPANAIGSASETQQSAPAGPQPQVGKASGAAAIQTQRSAPAEPPSGAGGRALRFLRSFTVQRDRT